MIGQLVARASHRDNALQRALDLPDSRIRQQVRLSIRVACARRMTAIPGQWDHLMREAMYDDGWR
jgi:hypothetical protein